MKLFSLLFAVLAVLVTTVLAWEKEDHEIFDLVTELEAAEGKKTTFYSWLEVPSTATTNEIAKAYRKKSMQLHPDKNPDVKGIHERFARLGVIAKILRNKEERKRYDFFYKNGVPVWRGTGYYYERFRPGLGSVVVFLTMLTSGLQYLVQRINYTKDLKRIENIVTKAKAAAWGPKLVPINGQRKVRVSLGDTREEGGYGGTKWLDMVVEDNQVYLLDPSGDMHLIDSSTAILPTISNTWFIALCKSLFHRLTGQKGTHGAPPTPSTAAQPNGGAGPDVDSDDASTTGSEAAGGSGKSTPRNGEDAKRGPAVKAGGMRRKAVRKRQ
ncbi:DnaJ domain-containing protein [Crassisporium funariophilum]|nr:DnaJ domain-containing protein [Crassisporium funariophilum]